MFQWPSAVIFTWMTYCCPSENWRTFSSTSTAGKPLTFKYNFILLYHLLKQLFFLKTSGFCFSGMLQGTCFLAEFIQIIYQAQAMWCLGMLCHVYIRQLWKLPYFTWRMCTSQVSVQKWQESDPVTTQHSHMAVADLTLACWGIGQLWQVIMWTALSCTGYGATYKTLHWIAQLLALPKNLFWKSARGLQVWDAQAVDVFKGMA